MLDLSLLQVTFTELQETYGFMGDAVWKEVV